MWKNRPKPKLGKTRLLHLPCAAVEKKRRQLGHAPIVMEYDRVVHRHAGVRARVPHDLPAAIGLEVRDHARRRDVPAASAGGVPVDCYGVKRRRCHVRRVDVPAVAVVGEREHQIGLGQLVVLGLVAQEGLGSHLPHLALVAHGGPEDAAKVEGSVSAFVADVFPGSGDRARRDVGGVGNQAVRDGPHAGARQARVPLLELAVPEEWLAKDHPKWSVFVHISDSNSRRARC